jgi:putative ABC transport system permease protein
MIRNYIKVALRAIFRNKLTAFINIAGLALAITSALLIYLYIIDEVGYDKYNSKADRIYRITRDFLSPDGEANLRLGNVAPPVGPLVKNDFGEVEVMARTINYSGLVIGLEENGELKKAFTENYLFLAEPELFKIFDFNVTAGDKETGLARPFTVMLSEKAAEKYFGDQNVIGKRLRGNDQFDLEVTGVYKNLPAQSHWHPDLLVSFSTLNDSTIYGRRNLETNWGNNSFGTYILLDEGYDQQKLEAKMPAFLDKHFGPYAIANYGVAKDFVASKATRLHVQKVSDIHLYSHLDDELEVNGNINNLYMMGVIGLFIVLIACFNFINLSTARATKRAKEVGMRKAVGAHKNQLIGQYLSESILTAFFALILALGLSILAIDWMNQFTRKELSLSLVSSLSLGLVGFTLCVGFLAGIYPAFVISGFKPVEVLKGKQGTVPGKGGLRKALVVSQFAISIVLIIATAITSQQLGYLNSRNLGFDRDQLVVLPYYNDLENNYESFYNELLKSSTIKNAARSSRIPTGRLLDDQGTPSITKGDSLFDSGITTKYVTTDYEFMNTFGIDLVAGRNFSKEIPTDDSLAFIVNEAAVRKYGWKTPEEGINKDYTYGGVKGKLIGVVKDFHFESLHQEIVPMIFFPDYYNNLSVKIAGKNVQEGLTYLEKVWKEFLPKRPFDYQFLSENYSRLYEAEQKQSQLFTIFSGLAIFIACLGLFGLATFNTLQRVKEIGIRKVLGASIPSILTLLSKEIVILILIANVIAWPVAWYLMGLWLDSFAYHIDMDILLYALASVTTVIIALATVSAQTIKAARTNPANTLRYE